MTQLFSGNGSHRRLSIAWLLPMVLPVLIIAGVLLVRICTPMPSIDRAVFGCSVVALILACIHGIRARMPISVVRSLLIASPVAVMAFPVTHDLAASADAFVAVLLPRAFGHVRDRWPSSPSS